MCRRFLINAVLLLGLASGAQSTPLLNQPLLPLDGRASHVSAGGTVGFVVYDRIALAETSLVTQVSWIGAFIDTQVLSNNPVAPTATSWHFRVAQDAAGNPGAATDDATVAFADATATLLGSTTLAGQAVQYYQFVATLADPLLIMGDEVQWFSVFAEAPNADPRFAWFSGQGGDGVSKQLLLGSAQINTYADRALTLDGNVVPLPSTLHLLAVPLALLLIPRHRFAATRSVRPGRSNGKPQNVLGLLSEFQRSASLNAGMLKAKASPAVSAPIGF